MASPNTIHLGGPYTRRTEYVVGETGIVPGMHVELRPESGVKKWYRVASATEITNIAIAMDRPLANKTIDTAYSLGDQLEVFEYGPGGYFYGLVASGQNIENGELLAPKGSTTGHFISAGTTTAAANIGRVRAEENLGLVAANTRCRMSVLY